MPKEKKADNSRANDTKANEVKQTVEQYLAALEEPRRSEVTTLHHLIRSLAPDLSSGVASGMIGYGSYHYAYDSGREGDAPIIALSSRKNYISLYVSAAQNGAYVAEGYKDRLPKADIGKSCVRFKKLSDIDQTVLSDLINEGIRVLAQQYPNSNQLSDR